MNDRDVSAYKILGHSLSFAAHVAAEFPEDFAETVARWEPDSMDEIIEALTNQKERRAFNGNNV